MPKTRTSFSKENPSRVPRGKGKKTLMLEAVRATYGTEKEYFQAIVNSSLTPEINSTLVAQVLQRIEPPMKATLPVINFEFDVTLKPHEQVLQIVKATANGEIIPEAAQILINGITSVMKIKEISDLEDRIKDLEGLAGVNEE
jgi:hypothetical protein